MSDLEWNTSWDSVIVHDDQLLPNHYSLTINFDIETDDPEEQNVAFDRITYFINNILNDSIFVAIDDERAGYFLTSFKQRLVTFTRVPQDMIVVATLYAKLISIVEGKINIEKIKLSSTQGAGVVIKFDNEFAEESTALTSHELLNSAKKDPWWLRSDCGTADIFKLEGDILTYVTDVSPWSDADLDWPKNENTKKDASNWNPTIIPGGKTHH